MCVRWLEESCSLVRGNHVCVRWLEGIMCVFAG